MDLTLAQKIIQVLLFEGTSMKLLDLAKFLNVKKEEVEENLGEVTTLLQTLNLKLIQNGTSVEIALGDEINSLINKNKIEELKTELSESALQTLAVILYKTKATKAEIDFVRGVDSVRSIKNLLTRGIIEKLEEKNKKYYLPTTETLRYLNVDKVDNMKDFSEISVKLKTLIEGE